jgi:hypothetical protein
MKTVPVVGPVGKWEGAFFAAFHFPTGLFLSFFGAFFLSLDSQPSFTEKNLV